MVGHHRNSHHQLVFPKRYGLISAEGERADVAQYLEHDVRRVDIGGELEERLDVAFANFSPEMVKPVAAVVQEEVIRSIESTAPIVTQATSEVRCLQERAIIST